jgi:pyrimidine deaminase RibD-like protein
VNCLLPEEFRHFSRYCDACAPIADLIDAEAARLEAPSTDKPEEPKTSTKSLEWLIHEVFDPAVKIAGMLRSAGRNLGRVLSSPEYHEARNRFRAGVERAGEAYKDLPYGDVQVAIGSLQSDVRGLQTISDPATAWAIAEVLNVAAMLGWTAILNHLPAGAPAPPTAKEAATGEGIKKTASVVPLTQGEDNSRDAVAPDLQRRFMEMAVEEARKSKPEDDGVHPMVGAVVVKDGEVLATAHRGEMGKGDHAEFTALEKKLRDRPIAGATVYTTLEPCTRRGPKKVPCVERLIARRVRRVVIGTPDPNRTVYGEGWAKLREANIATADFNPDLKAQVEEMNRDFIRQHKQPQATRECENGPGQAPTSLTAPVTNQELRLQLEMLAPMMQPAEMLSALRERIPMVGVADSEVAKLLADDGNPHDILARLRCLVASGPLLPQTKAGAPAAITPKPVLVDTPEQLIAAGDMSNTGFETNHRRAHEILSRFTEKQWGGRLENAEIARKLVDFVRDRELTGTDFGTISRFHWGVIHSRLLSLGQVKTLDSA